MGYAIAAQARRRRHDVVLVSGPVAIAPPRGVTVIQVTTAAEMYTAACEAFDSCDAAVLTAAVCDYRPARTIDHKLKKRAVPRTVTLAPTRDIAAHLGEIKGYRVVIGFAMEDHDHHRHAESKLRRKRCDAIVLNGPGNVGSDDAVIEILRSGRSSDGWSAPIRGSKQEIAGLVVNLTKQLSDARRPSPARRRSG